MTCGSEAECQGGVEESGLQLARNNQPGKAQVQPRLEGEEVGEEGNGWRGRKVQTNIGKYSMASL